MGKFKGIKLGFSEVESSAIGSNYQTKNSLIQLIREFSQFILAVFLRDRVNS